MWSRSIQSNPQERHDSMILEPLSHVFKTARTCLKSMARRQEQPWDWLLERQKLRRTQILTLNRIRIFTRMKLITAFEKLSPPEKRNPPLWRACENTIWSLAFKQIKACNVSYFSPLAQLFLQEARRTLFSLPYETVNQEEQFYKKFVKIKNSYIDTLNEMSKKEVVDTKIVY